MSEFDFNTPHERRNTGCAKWDDAARIFGSAEVLPMWVADMDFPAPPAVLEALAEQSSRGIYGYPASTQDAALSALAGWLDRRQGWKAPLEQIVLCPGVVPSLKTAIDAFTEPGDEILVQPPVYHPFFDIARSDGRILSENPLVERDGAWSIDLEDLEAKARTAKLLILCNPHNPVGRAWTRQELSSIAEICARTGTLVLSDEIHADLVFAPSTHTPLAMLDKLPDPLIATFVAPSKTFNLAGLNISAAIIPDGSLRRKFIRVFRDRGIPCTNAPGLVAFEAAYRSGDEWLDALLLHLLGQAHHLANAVRDRWPGVKTRLPEATYLCWLDCRELGLAESGIVKLFTDEARVGLNRGGMFGEQGRGWMRLNFATTRSILEEGIDRIAKALEFRAI